MVVEASLPASFNPLSAFSFKKNKKNKFLFSPITKWHLEFLSARSEKEREARGLWCQEHIDACLCNHRNL